MRLVAEALERCWEEWKKLDEEKEQIVVAMKLVAKEAAEVVVEREWRIVLQVCFFFLGFLQFLAGN